MMTVTFDYPAGANKPLRHSKVEIKLPRISGDIGTIRLMSSPLFITAIWPTQNFDLNTESIDFKPHQLQIVFFSV